MDNCNFTVFISCASRKLTSHKTCSMHIRTKIGEPRTAFLKITVKCNYCDIFPTGNLQILLAVSDKAGYNYAIIASFNFVLKCLSKALIRYFKAYVLHIDIF